ncbi:MAG: hypothetical protein AAGC78_12425 [Cellvibrio sp.]|uniref:hypothetical protein n=1 Tax=Cellvibrio sp. TaxID=1965322 RepID=UPI0031A3578A
MTAKDVILINPKNPTSPLQIASSIQSTFLTLPQADYNSTSGLSNLRPAYVVFIKDGKLYKTDLNTTTPTPVQFSNETQVAVSCEDGSSGSGVLTSFPDYVPTSSVIFYSAKSGNTCTNKAVTVAMDINSAPINLGTKEVLAPYMNSDSGRIAGFIVRDGSNYGYVNTQFNNFVSLGSVVDEVSVINGSRKSLLIAVDGAIKRFDYSTKQLSSSIITYPDNNSTIGISDNSDYYWSAPELNSQGASTGKTTINKLTDTATPQLSTLFTSNQPFMTLLDLTNTKLVLSDPTGYSTLNKTGGSLSALNIPANAVTLGANNERVFYLSINVTDQSQSTFGSILSNNTSNIEHKNTGLISLYGAAISLYDSLSIDRYVVVKYADDRLTMAKGTVSMISGTTGQSLNTLGSLPDVGYDLADADTFRFGATSLCKTTTMKCDAFYYNDQSNSLVRVTNLVQ